MKHYLLFTGMTPGSLTAIVKTDTIHPMRGYPDYIVPVTPRIFWARSKNARESVTEKLDVLGQLGYQKDMTFDARGLIKILFGYLPVAK